MARTEVVLMDAVMAVLIVHTAMECGRADPSLNPTEAAASSHHGALETEYAQQRGRLLNRLPARPYTRRHSDEANRRNCRGGGGFRKNARDI